MTDYREQIFDGGTVELDGNSFDTCVFRDVTLLFNGRETFSFFGCEYHDTRFAFGQPAELIAYHIGALWHHPEFGETIQRLVLQELPKQSKKVN